MRLFNRWLPFFGSLLLPIFSASVAHAEIETCFDDTIAYDSNTGLSWITDYRSSNNGGYYFGDRLCDAAATAASLDVEGVVGWRIPTALEYQSVFLHMADCYYGMCETVAGQGVRSGIWWNVAGGRFHTSNCVPAGSNCLGVCGVPGSPAHETIWTATELHPGHVDPHQEVHNRGLLGTVEAYSTSPSMAVRSGNACPASPGPSPGVFCINGAGDGSDWSWQLDANAPVTVTGPTPSTAGDLRDAFVSSLNLAAIAGLSATPGPGAACFAVAYSSSFQFWVGPPGGPVTCLVTGNPLGCSFNPMIYEQAFLPVLLPALTTGGTIAAAAAVALAALVLIRRRRAASARAH